MTLRTRSADALIGLLVLGAVAVALITIVVTRGWTERRVTIYMRSPSVQDLKQDTPVFLQGLNIGEVSAISPMGDSLAMGAPEFLVALRLRERYANGVPIRLPLGTSGEIVSTGLIGSASIALVVPKNDIVAILVEGDTIRGALTQGWTDVLKEVADTLRTQVSHILSDTRHLLATLDRTAATAHAEMTTTAPDLRATLASARQVLDRLEPMIEQARTTMAVADTSVATLQDSLSLLLSDTRRLVNHADTLTVDVTRTTDQLTPDVRQTLRNIHDLSVKLEYFMDQISRRPHRLLTGVRPLPSDTMPRDSTR
ncbi:MAG: MlaD family protein [Gemmatimonadales bacterium]